MEKIDKSFYNLILHNDYNLEELYFYLDNYGTARDFEKFLLYKKKLATSFFKVVTTRRHINLSSADYLDFIDYGINFASKKEQIDFKNKLIQLNVTDINEFYKQKKIIFDASHAIKSINFKLNKVIDRTDNLKFEDFFENLCNIKEENIADLIDSFFFDNDIAIINNYENNIYKKISIDIPYLEKCCYASSALNKIAKKHNTTKEVIKSTCRKFFTHYNIACPTLSRSEIDGDLIFILKIIELEENLAYKFITYCNLYSSNFNEEKINKYCNFLKNKLKISKSTELKMDILRKRLTTYMNMNIERKNITKEIKTIGEFTNKDN